MITKREAIERARKALAVAPYFPQQLRNVAILLLREELRYCDFTECPKSREDYERVTREIEELRNGNLD